MVSAKGGSGKTLITTSFATFLAYLGKKVLIVDTDASTNGLSLLFIKEVKTARDFSISEKRKPIGVYEWKKIGDEFQVVELSTNLSMIPANYEFFDISEDDWESYRESLGEINNYFNDKFDYIFFDAQAGADRFAKIVMSPNISDEAIIVSEYDPLSAAGVERLKGLLPEELNYYRTWILINKILPEFTKAFSDFLEIARYLSPIHWSADIVRAYARRQVHLKLEHCDETTFSIAKTLESFLGESIKSELENWYKTQSEEFKLPLKIQLEDTEKQIEKLIEEKRQPRAFLLTAFHENRASALGFIIGAIILEVIFLSFLDIFPFSNSIFSSYGKNSPLLIAVVFFILAISLYSGWQFASKFAELSLKNTSQKMSELEELEKAKLEILNKLDMDTKRLVSLRRKEAQVFE